MSMSYRYGDDPYYVPPEYEKGYEAGVDEARKGLPDLVEHLGTVIDELAAYIFRLDETFNRPLTDEETKLVEMGRAALKRIEEEL